MGLRSGSLNQHLLASLNHELNDVPHGTYQESCPLGVLELRTSLQLTSI